MTLAEEQIRDLFTSPVDAMNSGLWFSGERGDGEYKEWNRDGKLIVQCFWKSGQEEGEWKEWNSYGNINYHSIYKDGKMIKRII